VKIKDKNLCNFFSLRTGQSTEFGKGSREPGGRTTERRLGKNGGDERTGSKRALQKRWPSSWSFLLQMKASAVRNQGRRGEVESEKTLNSKKRRDEERVRLTNLLFALYTSVYKKGDRKGRQKVEKKK